MSGEMLAALEAFLYGTVWHFISNTWFYRVLFGSDRLLDEPASGAIRLVIQCQVVRNATK